MKSSENVKTVSLVKTAVLEINVDLSLVRRTPVLNGQIGPNGEVVIKSVEMAKWPDTGRVIFIFVFSSFSTRSEVSKFDNN